MSRAGSVRRPTMRDVARLADVGIKTVSRVVNDEPGVSEALRARVLAAAGALHYEPDAAAGSLRRNDRRTRSIGLLVPSVDNPFSSEIHRAIEDVVAPAGIAVLAASLDDDPDRETRLVRALLQRRVDGLLLATIRHSQAYLYRELERGFPIVFVDRAPTDVVADVVSGDNAAGGALVARHLVERGHRRIAVLADQDLLSTARLRREGFWSEAMRLGLRDADIIVRTGVTDATHAQTACLEILADENPPTALFTSQNLITWGALRALRERGRQHEIALVGYDDFDLADLLDPPVTVVSQSPRQIGRVAAERLLARVEGREPPAETVLIPPRLIARGSGEIMPAERSHA